MADDRGRSVVVAAAVAEVGGDGEDDVGGKDDATRMTTEEVDRQEPRCRWWQRRQWRHLASSNYTQSNMNSGGYDRNYWPHIFPFSFPFPILSDPHLFFIPYPSFPTHPTLDTPSPVLWLRVWGFFSLGFFLFEIDKGKF